MFTIKIAVGLFLSILYKKNNQTIFKPPAEINVNEKTYFN